jgi:DNA-binding response OmpR family regulator
MSESQPAGRFADTGEVLIVDDSAYSLRLLNDLLTQAGYRTRPASDGMTALRSAEARAPDLILLDIRMPGLDGYEVCRRLKANEAIRDVPVVFISGASDPLDKVLAFEVGGLDHIPKPFDQMEVLARVSAHIRVRQMQRELSERNADLKRHVEELEESMLRIKRLEGLLPICANCKRIRTGAADGEVPTWLPVEVYITKRTDATFTHGICPECAEKLYPGL